MEAHSPRERARAEICTLSLASSLLDRWRTVGVIGLLLGLLLGGSRLLGLALCGRISWLRRGLFQALLLGRLGHFGGRHGRRAWLPSCRVGIGGVLRQIDQR